MTRFGTPTRGGDRRRTSVAFATLFGILAAYMVMQTVRDTVFLSRLPATQLPWVYLAVAVAATAVAGLPARMQRPGRSVSTLAVLLAAAAAVTAGATKLIAGSVPGAEHALYVWTGIFGTLSTFQFWITVGRMHSVMQAKRRYALIGTGSVAGALAGASLAAWLTSLMDPAEVLWVAAGLMLLTALVAKVGFHGATRADPQVLAASGSNAPQADLRRAMGHPYVRRLAILALVSGITLTLADYWFKHEVAHRIAPEEMGPFLGSTYAALHALALVTQVAVTGWLIEKIGAPRALWVVPGMLLIGAGGAAVGVGLAAAIGIKAANETLRHTVDSTANEILHLPIPVSLRATAKRIIDLAARRSAQALGALVILAVGWLAPGAALVPVLLLGGALVWIGLVAGVRRQYLEMLRAALRHDSRCLPSAAA